MRSGGASAGGAEAHLEDANWVYTALNKAVEQEDYARASQCVRRARLKPTGAARRVFCAALRHATRRRLRDRLWQRLKEKKMRASSPGTPARCCRCASIRRGKSWRRVEVLVTRVFVFGPQKAVHPLGRR